jgi:hypothetical protein
VPDLPCVFRGSICVPRCGGPTTRPRKWLLTHHTEQANVGRPRCTLLIQRIHVVRCTPHLRCFYAAPYVPVLGGISQPPTFVAKIDFSSSKMQLRQNWQCLYTCALTARPVKQGALAGPRTDCKSRSLEFSRAVCVSFLQPPMLPSTWSPAEVSAWLGSITPAFHPPALLAEYQKIFSDNDIDGAMVDGANVAPPFA